MTNSRPRCAILPARASASAPQPKNTSPRIGPFIAPPTSCASIQSLQRRAVQWIRRVDPDGHAGRDVLGVDRYRARGGQRCAQCADRPVIRTEPCQLAKEDIRTVLRHYAGGFHWVLFQPRTDALHGDVRPLELPAVDQHLADGHIRPAIPPGEADTHNLSSGQGEPVRSPGSAGRRHRWGSPDRESAAHGCPMRRPPSPRGPSMA